MPEVDLEFGRLAAARGEHARALALYADAAERHRLVAAVDGLAELARVELASQAPTGLSPWSASPPAAAPVEPAPAVAALLRLASQTGGAAVQARLRLADLALAEGLDDAAEHWLRQVGAAGDDFDLALRRGRLAYRRRQLAEAAGHFRAAVSSRPLEAAGYQGFGDVALASGDTASALRAYERALVREPLNKELHVFVTKLRGHDRSHR
jgi:tetratricopeptide (TPR) repeat protein